MSSWNAIKAGLRQIGRNWKMGLVLYVFNILFALVVVFPLNDFLQRQFADSLAFGKLMETFDFHIITDVMNHYGDGIMSMLNLSVVVLLLFWLINVFFNGGIISTFQTKERFTTASFWKWNATYFWRMLRLALYFLIIYVIFIGIFWSIFMAIGKGFDPDHLISEAGALHWGEALLLIFVLISSVVLMVHDYVKLALVQSNQKWLFSSFGKGIRFAFGQFKRTYGAYLILGLFFFLVWLGYTQLNLSFENTNFSKLILFFIIGQMFLLFRIFMRLLNLATANQLFKNA